MDEVNEKADDLCLICNEFMGQFKNHLAHPTNFSRKPIFQLFGECLGGKETQRPLSYARRPISETFISVNLPQQSVDDRKICQNCFIKFNELDEHQTIVEKIQNDLLLLYNNTLSMTLDIKHNIKIENYDIAEVDVQEEENFFESEPEYKPEIVRKRMHRRRERYEDEYRERRRRRAKAMKREEEDTARGYTVIEIDGEKWYKCDICQKVLQRRIKNHREIHTSERNVKCEVCGSMFKTLACLYTHRKIHKERKYHQW
jgi:hypothetical protein